MISFYNCLLFSTALLFNAMRVLAASPYFSGVQVLDSYTGTSTCTNVDHWFLVKPEITIPANADATDIEITVPLAFNTKTDGSFDLYYGSTTVGTVSSSAGSNTFTVAFNSVVSTLEEEITVDFNLLAQFTESAMELISKPMTISYAFKASDSKTFTPSITFAAIDLTQITTDGGIYSGNNSAWFVVDIPVALLDGDVTIGAEVIGEYGLAYYTELTTFEIVTAVDEFNQPLSSVPFTAYKDVSTAAAIAIDINSNVSGGKYLRIAYYSGPLTSDYVINQVTINNSTKITSTLYAESATNVEVNPESGVAATPESLTLGTASNITVASTVSSSTVEATVNPSLLASTDSTDSTDSSSNEVLDSLTDSLDSDNSTTTSSVIISTISTDIPVASTAGPVVENELLNSTTTAITSSVVATTSSVVATTAAVNETTSIDLGSQDALDATNLNRTTSTANLVASTTSALDYGSNMTTTSSSSLVTDLLNISIPSATAFQNTSSNDAYETYTVLESTQSADVTVMTSLVPVATLSGSTVESSVLYTSTIKNATIAADERSTSSLVIVTATQLSTTVVTTTSCSNKLCVIATTTVPVTNVFTTTSCPPESTTVKSSYKTEVSEGVVLSTESQSADAVVQTQLIPVSTLASSKTIVAQQTHSTKTLTASVDETIIAYTTESCSTTSSTGSVVVEHGYTTSLETQSASVTSYEALLGASTLAHPSSTTLQIAVQSSSSVAAASSYIISYYEAGASQLTMGLGGIIIGFITLFL